MTNPSRDIVLCNGADTTDWKASPGHAAHLTLEYRDLPGVEQNVRLKLPRFVREVSYLPGRILDLLEIAAYVYCADRYVARGKKSDLEYHGWPRRFDFLIRVRDYAFWRQPQVAGQLDALLSFLSGNTEMKFSFRPGHSTPRTSLFDQEGFAPQDSSDTDIVLFSGGLDSLTGVVERLNEASGNVCLVSHRSGQPATCKTQDQLFVALAAVYPNRLRHYKFHCSLTGERAHEETQRTRFFLYTSIAYALAYAFGRSSIYVYENGITSLNFPKRQDLMHARASRTTHPKTISLLKVFLSEVAQADFQVITPFFWKTKTDVAETLARHQRLDLLSSSVSCSKTFKIEGHGTHCGGCSQCVDRRFAAFAAEVEEFDDCGIYAVDFVRQGIGDGDIRTTLVDFVRQAGEFSQFSLDRFYKERLNDLTEIVSFLGDLHEEDAIDRLWELCRRHGRQVAKAIQRMREVFDDPYVKLPDDSLLRLINAREHLKEPVLRLVEDISNRLKSALPIAFQRNRPKDENDLNDKISAYLQSHAHDLEREHPAIPFALARTVPDHSLQNHKLAIETKYIRGSTTPAKITDGLAADLKKYHGESYRLFVVYDPDRAIHDDAKFKADFERDERCTVCIIR